MAVRVVTDSTADLPAALAEELGITVVPLNVHFGTEVYRDGVDISPDQFYARLVSSPTLPTTSQPSVGDFLQTYEALSENEDQVVSVHVSAKLSGTLNSAVQAVQQVRGTTRVETVDSLQGSLGLGLVAIAAGRAAQSGADMDEVLRATRDAMVRARFFGLLDTLKVPGEGWANREGPGVRRLAASDQATAHHPRRRGASAGASSQPRQGHAAAVRSGGGERTAVRPCRGLHHHPRRGAGPGRPAAATAPQWRGVHQPGRPRGGHLPGAAGSGCRAVDRRIASLAPAFSDLKSRG